MHTNNVKIMVTNDKIIRVALKKKLRDLYFDLDGTRIIDELSLFYGSVRLDIAVINGHIHGYELKSDVDTLSRLSDQVKIYNDTLDKMTLVVGIKHLHKAIRLIPDWWGIEVARMDKKGGVFFHEIRKDKFNPKQKKEAIASLLWRDEALRLLENIGRANDVRYKTRAIIYQRLAESLNKKELKEKVKKQLCTRTNWKPDLMYVPSGG